MQSNSLLMLYSCGLKRQSFIYAIKSISALSKFMWRLDTMSEYKKFLLEGEEVLFEAQYGFLPQLFGDERLIITNFRTIKEVSPNMLSRKTIIFLSHSIAKGQGLVPTWNKTLLVVGVSLLMIGLPLLTIIIGIIPLLAGLFVLYKGRDSAFVVFGQPDISIQIKESSDVEEALQLVTKLQNESRKKL